jgi:tRNA(fMet)-specific endonuclease VapC
MSFLLDTNICSAHFRQKAGLTHRFLQYSGRLFIPSIALGELFAGAYHAVDPAPLLLKINQLLEDTAVLPFDQSCAEQFGKIRGLLLRRGISVNSTDLMIASIAIVHDLILVTNNTADFRNIPDLRLENWLKP